jgi:small subunit ribosomal protein S16
MSTRIRLRRMGANKRPFYRVVVADQRSPRDGRFIENIGKYHPLDDPSVIEIDEERALHWLRVGAQPSDQVRNLMVKVGIWDKFVVERPAAAKLVTQRAEKPAQPKLSKKAAAKAAEEAAPPGAPAEEAPAPAEPAEATAESAVEADAAPEAEAEASAPEPEPEAEVEPEAAPAPESAAPEPEPEAEPATEE